MGLRRAVRTRGPKHEPDSVTVSLTTTDIDDGIVAVGQVPDEQRNVFAPLPAAVAERIQLAPLESLKEDVKEEDVQEEAREEEANVEPTSLKLDAKGSDDVPFSSLTYIDPA